MEKTQRLSPEAFLAFGRNRHRLYNSNTVYMSDGEEFTIELYNPTNRTVAARIWLEGKPMSKLIELRPCERVFLDRHMDSPHKLVFNTYVAEAETEEQLSRGISENGAVKIEFFAESMQSRWPQPQPWRTPPSIPTYPLWHNYPGTGGWAYYSTTVAGNSGFNLTSYCSLPASVETGKIGSGDKSSQAFAEGAGEFQISPFAAFEYKILPVSLKPSDKVRVFCTNCGTRKKKTNWLHCPTCGTKF